MTNPRETRLGWYRLHHISGAEFHMMAAPFFWKGEDVPIKKGFILKAGETTEVKVALSPENLPQFDDFLLENLRVSVRSRFAQLGIHVGEYFPESIGIIKDEDDRKPREVTASITNFSGRAVNFNDGSRLFRFFHYNPGDLITHMKKLEELVQSGGIQIEGENGVEWKIDREHRGIMLRVSNRRYMPYNPKPAEIPDTGDYRDEIDALLKPIPVSEKPILWIGETPKVTLSESLEGVLSRNVVPGDPHEFYRDKNGMHINSHLIDAGSDWPIRVEVVSPTTPEKMPDFVLLRLAFAA